MGGSRGQEIETINLLANTVKPYLYYKYKILVGHGGTHLWSQLHPSRSIPRLFLNRTLRNKSVFVAEPIPVPVQESLCLSFPICDMQMIFASSLSYSVLCGDTQGPTLTRPSPGNKSKTVSKRRQQQQKTS